MDEVEPGRLSINTQINEDAYKHGRTFKQHMRWVARDFPQVKVLKESTYRLWWSTILRFGGSFVE